MEKSKVIVSVCKDYNEENVYNIIKAAIDNLGGIETFVKKEEKILVKPNFLYPSEENKAITTNPSVIKAVLRILNENGYVNVKYGDSPATGNSKNAATKLNLNLDNEFGAKLASMSEEVLVDNPKGTVAKSFYFSKDVVEADAIIGLSKMKTHMLELITGAVKNMYGLICGYRKAQGHVSFPNASIFAKMLTDIHNATPQRLHIMDGVVAMEGNGPSSGSPINMNVILTSTDPVAIDTIFCWLINLDPVLVPTNTQGYLGKIGTYKENEIEIVIHKDNKFKEISKDELVKEYGNFDFDVCREKAKTNILSIWSRITGKLSKKPVIDKDKCVKCGVCVNHCPVEGRAITFKNGKDNIPVYDYSKCIRCFCCQELCPQHAIKTK